MAETRLPSALTFDCSYSELLRLGLPIPLVVSLQSQQLTFESALWNARCSATGFSITLFWPASGGVKTVTKKQRSRCHKKSSQAADIRANTKEQMSQPRSEKTVDLPIPLKEPLLTRQLMLMKSRHPFYLLIHH